MTKKSVLIPEELHKELKLEAALSGKNIYDILSESYELYKIANSVK